MTLFPKILFEIDLNTYKGQSIINEQLQKGFCPYYTKLCINYENINPLREKIVEYYILYKNFLDLDFITSFQKKDTFSHLGELLAFSILEKNNFTFKNTKTKKNQFPDIETLEGEIFEVTRISVNRENYWGKEEKNGIYTKQGRLEDFYSEESVKFTGKINEKNKDFFRRNITGNLIIFPHSELLDFSGVIARLQYGNFLETINKTGYQEYIGLNKDFSKESGVIIKPLDRDNGSYTSNIKSIFLIGYDPATFLSKTLRSEPIPYLHWKNPKVHVNFNLEI